MHPEKRGGAVDTHGARAQWMCVFVYNVDSETQPASARRPLEFTAVYLARVGLRIFGRTRGENWGRVPRRCTGTESGSSGRVGSTGCRGTDPRGDDW